MAFAALLLLPTNLHAHIRLESSAPARDEVLAAPPTELRLLFSARIEARYASVELVAPDGSVVDLGPVAFVGGSDREITVTVPPLARSGRYVVRWRAAGADGHMLEGTFSFTLAEGAVQDPVALDSAAHEPAPPDATDVAEQDHHHHAEAEDEQGRPWEAFARGLHFLSLLLLTGGLAFRTVLLPRLDVSPETRTVLVRRAWRAIAVAAVLLAVAAVLRLWFQSIALHGAERAWSTPLLSIMLRDTAWGRAWVLQAFLFALLGMAIVWAGPLRDRTALMAAIPAALGLAAIPALSGHAAGIGSLAPLAIAVDTLHVVSTGTWLGTLAVVLIVAIPVLRLRETRDTVADAVDRFSPIALVAAATAVLTGVISSLLHIAEPAQLWSTDYGRTLLIKLALVACVALAGFVNWRVVKPRLRAADTPWRLEVSATTELLFAILVLAATAVLTGQPRP